MAAGVDLPSYPDESRDVISYPQDTGDRGAKISATDTISGAAGGSAGYSLEINSAPGVLRLSSTANASAPDAPDPPHGFRFPDFDGNNQAGSASGDVQGIVHYRDMQTFHIPNATSADRFTVQSKWDIHGSLSASDFGTPVSAYAALRISTPSGVAISGAYPNGTYGEYVDNCCWQPDAYSSRPTGSDLERIQPLITSATVTKTFISDIPIEVDFTDEIDASALGIKYDSESHGCPCEPGHAQASASFSNTISWGGIISIIDDATGQPVTDYTVTSASGFDYSKPFVEAVPEPAPSSLFSAGLLGLGMLFRIRKRQARCGRSCAAVPVPTSS